LSTMLSGIGRIAELIADVTTVSREQSATMRHLTEVIDGVQGVSDEATLQAREAADAATRQMRALEGLAETSRSLAMLAERLRRSTGRFRVPTESAAALAESGATPNGSTDSFPAVRPNVPSAGRGRSLTAA